MFCNKFQMFEEKHLNLSLKWKVGVAESQSVYPIYINLSCTASFSTVAYTTLRCYRALKHRLGDSFLGVTSIDLTHRLK